MCTMVLLASLNLLEAIPLMKDGRCVGDCWDLLASRSIRSASRLIDVADSAPDDRGADDKGDDDDDRNGDEE